MATSVEDESRPALEADVTSDADGVVVIVQPAGHRVHVESGESLMAAAQRQGLVWPTRCRGQALCTACLFEVVSEPNAFEAPAPKEQEVLDSLQAYRSRRRGEIRLACQARAIRPAVVMKRGVVPAGSARAFPVILG